MYIYSLTKTNGLRFKRRITDVRRNERSRVAVHLGKDSWTWGYLIEASGTAAQFARNVHCPSVFGARTREYTGDRRAGTTVRSDLRSSQARASNPRATFSPLCGYVRMDTATIVSGDVPGFALATPSAIIHVACWKRRWDLHRRKRPSGES